MVLRWYGGSKVVRWFLFHFPWFAWFLCLNILYSSVFVSGFLFGRGVGVKIGLCLIWYIFF